MVKKLHLSDYVLLGAALVGEFVEEVRLVGGLVPFAMRGRYGFVPPAYRRNSYLTVASQLVVAGDIRKVVDPKGEAYWELTAQGKGTFKKRFSLFSLSSKRWDGFFMIVAFDIPEKERKDRDRLRSILTELGFGMLQESVWISPFHLEGELREYLESAGLEDKAFVLQAKKLWVGDLKSLAEKIWNLQKIDSSYKEIVRTLKGVTKLTGNEKKKAVKKTLEKYFHTLSVDPILPKELLPTYWSRGEAVKCLNSLLISNSGI